LTASPAAGQAAVEYGLGAARAGTTAAPAKGIGKSMSGLADKLNQTLKTEQRDSQGSPARTTVRYSSPAKVSPAPAQNWEDPDGIQKGLDYAELVRRFGPPAMAITGDTGTSLTYSGKAGTFLLEVREGKVASIEKPRS
jgi:hypothetical protein